MSATIERNAPVRVGDRIRPVWRNRFGERRVGKVRRVQSVDEHGNPGVRISPRLMLWTVREYEVYGPMFQ